VSEHRSDAVTIPTKPFITVQWPRNACPASDDPGSVAAIEAMTAIAKAAAIKDAHCGRFSDDPLTLLQPRP